MIPVHYESVHGQATALTWPAASVADLEAFTGSENVNGVTPDCLQVRNSAGEWVTLCDGWSVIITDRGDRIVISAHALARLYQPVPD